MQDQAYLDPEIVQRAAQMAATVAQEIQVHQRQLGQPVSALAGRWDGLAYQAFVPVYEQWEQGVTRLVNALTSLGENTSVAVATYESADQESASGITSVAGHSPFGGALQA